jgi:hypothetical protein
MEVTAKMKAHFLTSWAQLRGRVQGPMHKNVHDWGMVPRLKELCGVGVFG